ncbi:TonB-dependent receptor [Zobellia galactanivorans]|uniref:TonB-dependent Receptor n=1 Tax=Zobellia galactanivorans (strain DSM 12802 / CCUG 47099 / CIP 106680 / NCIMB 13871 / Dsij) TaxID=63186 RepID=G0L6B7_ZOBGA|nr:TonB-dependent receptor [Zobellia galactanivorans]CAZ96831.1 TonB-dependent Receptor [Zobellia galactanivorans]
MKNILFVLVIALAGLSGNAQTVYRGQVTDENGVPLEGATIVSLSDTTIGVMTDAEGIYEIALDNPQVSISYVGFLTTQKTLKQGFNQTLLRENTTNLTEVVVTGNRESQKRSEVPAAISVIDSKDLAETKAFGIDQVVNQVSGVFMMTSRVASNEQHMMAVRSPLSTKALFLYLEDGLQIRPTSVFNHNALLEMNDISYGRVEVLKGPASSIYGSEAIGGSFNFITKRPTEDLTGSVGLQHNDLGLSRYELEISDSPSDRLGLYLGTHFVQRKNGPIEFSDYEKFALTFKTVYDLSVRSEWTNVIDLVDYRSDMTGSLSEADYTGGNFESDQTFADRDALAFRVRSTLETRWNDRNKTSFNLVFRKNQMDQNPSYRIRQFREDGQLTGEGSGEVNSNRYNSYMGLVQHKLDFDFKDSQLVFGATVDFSPQDYIAENTRVVVDTETGRNIDFSLQSGSYILNYNADILNYAGFAQYEISVIEKLKMTAALRFDRFQYVYRNRMEGLGDQRSTDTYGNLTPKLGFNYNFNALSGIYTNYSQGFTPPQVSTLYRNRNELVDIKPSIYNNYELGGYFNIAQKIKLDGALYMIDGKNTLITIRDDDDVFINTNAGKTRSYGIEYGVTYTPSPKLSLTHNGSYARHRYISFFDSGIDYSGTDRESAPRLLGLSRITYRPLENLSITAEHELVGDYNTSFEGQVDMGDGTFGTSTYKGHSIFNLRAVYRLKHIELWAHALNIFDELYAARASYSSFSGENSYSIGNPLAFHGGVRYLF